MIFISHPTTTSQGVTVSHHQLVRAELSSDFTQLGLWLDAWVAESDRLAGGAPVARLHVAAPVDGIGSPAGLMDAIAAALLADPMYAGGAVVPDAAGTLLDAQLRRWAAIKACRAAVEFGPLTWDGSTFDADSLSQFRILGEVVNAMRALTASESFSIVWTLADDSERTLSAADMLALGQALGAQVDSAHATARALRAAIDAATTVAEVEAIVWPE